MGINQRLVNILRHVQKGDLDAAKDELGLAASDPEHDVYDENDPKYLKSTNNLYTLCQIGIAIQTIRKEQSSTQKI